MSEHMFGVTRHKLSARDVARRDRICREEGGYGYTQVDDSPAHGNRWIGWFVGPNRGEPFNRQLADRVLARIKKKEHVLHDCGGTVLTASLPSRPDWDQFSRGVIASGILVINRNKAEYQCCDRCGAFSFDDELPTGTNYAANMAAWDNGDDRSPDAVGEDR
jgi:hypothetical protein